MLNPARLWEILLVLKLMNTYRFALVIENHATRTGCSLVN